MHSTRFDDLDPLAELPNEDQEIPRKRFDDVDPLAEVHDNVFMTSCFGRRRSGGFTRMIPS